MEKKKIDKDSVFVPNPKVAYRKIDGKMVLIDTRDDSMITLNETGSLVWELLNENTVENIAGKLSKHFNVSADTAGEDATSFLLVLLNRGIVDFK